MELRKFNSYKELEKTHQQDILELCRLHKKEKAEFCENEKNLENMIYTEMCNHEYSFTEDPEDTLMALGKSFEDLEDGTDFRIAWDKAAAKR